MIGTSVMKKLTNLLRLFSMKTPENRNGFWCFQEVYKYNMGKKWVKQLLLLLQVFISVEEEFPSSFFMIWRVKGTDPTSRKMFSQSVLDSMMDPISKNHVLNPQYVIDSSFLLFRVYFTFQKF